MSVLRNVKKYIPDIFILAIIMMIVLAYLFPGIGGKGSFIELKTVSKYAIMLLFFFYGLRLSPEKLKKDLKNWKLHISIQLITFLFFPIVVLLFYPFFRNTEYHNLWLALFFLAALPSTVSSSVVLVSIAKGNVTGAIFNASVSGVIGILITPLWMGFFLTQTSADYDLLKVFIDLVIQILVPVLAGLLLHKFWGNWAIRNKEYFSIYDRCVILSVVYNSFSESFLNGIFRDIPNWTLFVLFVVVIGLFLLTLGFSSWISKKQKLSREDSITVIFCGTNKSLMHGTVMSNVIFAGNPAISLFLVPIMIYHAFQLFYLSIQSRKMGKNYD